MAREPSITAEQVYAVADAIRAEGGKATSRAVRERLGNVGSMGTINRFLQQWKSSQERRPTGALSLPAVLQNAILDFMGQELATSRAGLEAELAELQQEAGDLATENERQGEAIERLNEQVSVLSEERAAAEGKAAQLAADLENAHTEATAERQAAEHARTELAKALLRLEAMPRLEQDLDIARNEAAAERAGRTEAERTAAVLQAQKDDLQSRLGASAAAADAHRHELADCRAAAEAEVNRVREEAVRTVQQHRDESSSRLNELRTELARVREDGRLAREQATAMLEKHQKTIDTLSDALSAATAESRRAAEEAAELRGRNSSATEAGEKSGGRRDKTQG